MPKVCPRLPTRVVKMLHFSRKYEVALYRYKARYAKHEESHWGGGMMDSEKFSEFRSNIRCRWNMIVAVCSLIGS